MKTVSLRPHTLQAPLSPFEEGISGGLSLGLFALTLPAVGYALTQLWRLLSGGNLEQAVRAFVP